MNCEKTTRAQRRKETASHCTMERKNNKAGARQERKSLYLEASRRDTQQKGGAHKLLSKSVYRAKNSNNKFKRFSSDIPKQFPIVSNVSPLSILHKRYRARKTADGDFVQRTTVVDGKKVVGLDSKRGRPEVSQETVEKLEKNVWRRIRTEKIKAPDQKVESANAVIFQLASVPSILKQNIA